MIASYNIFPLLNKLLVTILILTNSINITPQLYADSENSRHTYNEILKLIGSKKYDLALQKSKLLINSDLTFSDVYIKTYNIYKYQNKLEEGLSYFRELSQTHPKNPYIYHTIGLFYNQTKDYQRAISNFKRSIELAPEYAKVYKAYILACENNKELEKAEEFLKNSLNYKNDNAAALYGLGFLCIKQQKWDEGLKNLNRAMQLDSTNLDINILRGVIYFYISEPDEFLNVSQQGLKLSQLTQDLEYECRFTSNIGLAFSNVGKFQQAIVYEENALKLAKEIGLQTEITKNIGNLGVDYRNIGDYKKALHYSEEAVKDAQQTGERNREGLNYRNIGTVYRLIGEYTKALEYFNKALPIAIETGDKYTEGLVLWSMGLLNWNFGNYYKALEYYENALEIAKEMGNRWAESRYYNSIGLIYWNLGNFTKALEYYEKALVIANEIKDKQGQVLLLGNIAIIYHEFRDDLKALEYYNHALKVSEEIGSKAEISRHLGNIGVSYHFMGEYERAMEYFQRALQITKEVGKRKELANMLGNVGVLYTDIGSYEKALSYIDKALNIGKEIGAKRIVTNQLVSLGKINFEFEKYDRAYDFFNEALKYAKLTVATQQIKEAHTGLAMVLEKQQKHDLALDHYKQAIREIEKARNWFSVEEYKTDFFTQHINIYEDIIDLLAFLHNRYPQKGYDEISFEFAERAKVRTLLDILFEGRIFHNIDDITSDFKEKFLIIEKKIELTYRELSEEFDKREEEQDEKKVITLRDKISDLQRKRSNLLEELKQRNPDYYQLTNPKLLTLKEVQQDILNEKQLLIEYFVGQEKVYSWIISKSELQFNTIPLKREELKIKLEEISPLFKQEKDFDNVQMNHRWANFKSALLHDFYKLLIEDHMGELLKSNYEIIFIPDDLLFYFPFEMLVTDLSQNSIHYLIESHTISYSSSASLLSYANYKKSEAEKELLAFGNPLVKHNNVIKGMNWFDYLVKFNPIFRNEQFVKLPHAEKEVNDIARNFSKATVITGQDASEHNFKRMAGQYQYIHLATHNVTNDKQPMYSKIILSQSNTGDEDGLLQTYEIYNLRLNADLVVLSGCNTGLGRLNRGEGLIGMTRAFLYAGSHSVVVSLWPVHDESTAILMNNFYKFMMNGYTKAQAMQKAKIALIHSKDWKKNPFYWGPFVLIGME